MRDIYGKDCIIDWVGKSFVTQLFKHDPRINKIHILNRRSLPYFFNRGKQKIVNYSKAHPYDLLINAESGPVFFDLVERIAAKKKIGSPYDLPISNCGHVVDDIRQTIKKRLPEATNIDKYSPQLYPNPQIPAQFKISKPYVVVTPATSRSLKKGYCPRTWPLENFKQLILGIAKKYSVVILGSKDDIEYTKDLSNLGENIYYWVGQSALDVLLSIIANAKLLIACDTGTTHMAAALNVPVIAIFGSSDYKATGPFSEHAKIFSCYLDNDCGPYKPQTHKEDAIKQITASDILRHI